METSHVEITIPRSARNRNKFEVEGLARVKRYIEADLLNENSCTEVRLFLEKVKVDDALLSKYLYGRKNDPFIAWDTIRRYAENKFQLYPEVFPSGIGVPDKVRELVSRHVVGTMKHRDKFGRRIVFVDTTKWDANVHTLEDLIIAAVVGCEKFWKEPDVLKNGVILIENTKGFGLAHAKQHTMLNLMRMRNIFMFSFPVAIKGIYYLNVPTIFSLVFKMSKPLFPKKMRSRMFLYSANQPHSDLFEIAPPEILPTWAGGKLSIEEAAEDITSLEKLSLS